MRGSDWKLRGSSSASNFPGPRIPDNVANRFLVYSQQTGQNLPSCPVGGSSAPAIVSVALVVKERIRPLCKKTRCAQVLDALTLTNTDSFDAYLIAFMVALWTDER